MSYSNGKENNVQKITDDVFHRCFKLYIAYLNKNCKTSNFPNVGMLVVV